jgi:hypothetical protein
MSPRWPELSHGCGSAASPGQLFRSGIIRPLSGSTSLAQRPGGTIGCRGLFPAVNRPVSEQRAATVGARYVEVDPCCPKPLPRWRTQRLLREVTEFAEGISHTDPQRAAAMLHMTHVIHVKGKPLAAGLRPAVPPEPAARCAGQCRVSWPCSLNLLRKRARRRRQSQYVGPLSCQGVTAGHERLCVK